MFDPVLPNHAIEQCAITITFDADLPDKLFARVMESFAEGVAKAGLTNRQRPRIAFKVDVATGNVSQDAGGGAPFLFSSRDNATQLTLLPNSLIFLTTSYSRWATFLGQFSLVTKEALGFYLENLAIKTVKIEYWDRFNSMVEWSKIDYRNLFVSGCDYISPRVFRSEKEWHSHAGWFAYGGKQVRRLTNVNIDIVEAISNNSGSKHPSVGIYTMMQDELVAAESVDVAVRLGELHLALKALFAELVTDEIKNRIGLGGA